MRIDRFLSDMGCGSRSELRKAIKSGLLSVNGQKVLDAGFPVKASDQILWRGEPMVYEMYQYFLLHKPAGVVTTTEKTSAQTVMDYCRGEGIRDDLFPVGRLDKDTTGLLLLTNEGALDHLLMSPKTHVQKEYSVTLKNPLDPRLKAIFLEGFEVPASEKGNDAFRALPSTLISEEDPYHVTLVLTEGKYHQVKRMFQVFQNEVTALKRTRIGRVSLPDDLPEGSFVRVNPALLRPQNRMEDLLSKEALLFDMDGTLIDSMGMWYDIDVEFCARHGADMPETLQKEIEGLSFYETAVYVLNRFPKELKGLTPEDLMDEWNEMAYEQYRYHIPLKPQVLEMLEALKKRGTKMGIATSNSGRLAYAALDHLGIRDYFSSVLTAEEITRGKPEADIYLQLAQNLCVKPEDCAVFEDVTQGLVSGARAGMMTVAVEDSYSADQRLIKERMSDFYLSDYSEFCLALEKEI